MQRYKNLWLCDRYVLNGVFLGEMRIEGRKKLTKKKKQDFLLSRDKWRYVSCTHTHADAEVTLRAFKQSPQSWAQPPPTKRNPPLGRPLPRLTVPTPPAPRSCRAARRRPAPAWRPGRRWGRRGRSEPALPAVACGRLPAGRPGPTGVVGFGVFSTHRGFRGRFTPVISGLLSSPLRAHESPPHALSGAEHRPVPGHRPLRAAASQPGRPALGPPLPSCRSRAKPTGCLAHHEPFLPVSA